MKPKGIICLVCISSLLWSIISSNCLRHTQNGSQQIRISNRFFPESRLLSVIACVFFFGQKYWVMNGIVLLLAVWGLSLTTMLSLGLMMPIILEFGLNYFKWIHMFTYVQGICSEMRRGRLMWLSLVITPNLTTTSWTFVLRPMLCKNGTNQQLIRKRC